MATRQTWRSVAAIAALFAAVGGCSNVQRAQEGVNDVRAEASFSRSTVLEVADSPPLNPTSPSPEADSARGKLQAVAASQVKILEITDGISVALTGVVDKESGWVTILKRYWWIVGLIVVMIFLTVSGGWTIVRSALSWVGLLIPKATRLQAQAGVAMLDPADPVTPREAIAVRRASDPTYNRAFEAAQKEQILKQAKAKVKT